jgi:ATP-dependent Lhr-like helicase
VATTLPSRQAEPPQPGVEALPLPEDLPVPEPAPAAAGPTGPVDTPADLDELAPDSILRSFHPAVAGWFLGRFPDGPTEPQRAAWPLIAEGGDVLVASPTGTGKTLTGFLVAIDAAYRAASDPTSPAGTTATPPAGPRVVYVSPLRALATDVHENLQVPLTGIAAEAARRGLATRRPPSGRPCAGRPPTCWSPPRSPCTCC